MMIYTFGECELDTQLHVLARAGQSVKLRPKAFEVLVHLLEHRDRIVTKHELCEQVWPNQFISDATLGSTVRAVRRAIGDTGEAHQLIRTVHGYGYRCLAPVTVGTAPQAAPNPTAEGSGVLTPPLLVPEAEVAGPATLQTIPPSVPPLVLSPGERKVVTVLCCAPVIPAADHASGDLDALSSLMQAFYACVQDAVQQYGGTLQPPMGDRVLAMFGAPLAQEDHVVRAGLAALALLQRLNEEPCPAGSSADVRLAVRIGVHTGLMVVGGLGDAPARFTTLVGDVTAQAVALQEHATPGTIFCSAAIARLLQGQLYCTAVGPVPLQGQASPAPAYTLHRGSSHRTPSGPLLGRALSPFVGQEQVMATLLALLAQAEAGRGQVVGVVGEAGMGKSRLVAEFCHSLEGRRLTVLLGRCRSYGGTTPYLPVLELLRHFCGLRETDSPEVSIAKVHHQLQAVGLASAGWAPMLLHFLELQENATLLTTLSPEARKARIVTLLTQLWLQASRQQPLLLVLEDLHWSDPSSEEWLGVLVERMVGAPLLVLSTYRPGYRPGWLDKSYVTQVTLAPLPDAASLRIVQGVLPPAAQTVPLVPRILATAEGNPFFLEELARTVVEQGAEAGDSRVPETIQAVLLARLDRLPATAKSLLQAAAVIGKDVALPLLQSITERSEESLQQDLTHLQAAEFLYETSLVPEPHYTFKHVLTQEVTYQSLLRRTRQHYHARIAQVLEAQFPTVALAQPELLAQHYTEAGFSAQAITYWQKAGRRAVERSAYVEAIVHLTTGLTVLQTLPETPARTQQELMLHVALGGSLVAIQGYATPEVARVYTRARELCQQLGDTPQLFPVLRGLFVFYLGYGQLQTAQNLAEHLLRQAERQSEVAPQILGHYLLGLALFCRGTPVDAARHFEQAIAAYDFQRHRQLVHIYGIDLGVVARGWMALSLWLLGYPDQALAQSAESWSLAQELAHPYSLAAAQILLAWLHQFRQEAQAAYDRAADSTALATQQGFTLFVAWGTVPQGWALTRQEQWAAGMATMREGLEAAVATGSEALHPYFLTLLAEAYGAAGQPEEGLRLLVEAQDVVARTGERFYEAELYRLTGVLQLAQAPAAQAEAELHMRHALDITRHQQAKSLELRAALSLSRLWKRQGKRGEARELLAPIYGWFTEGFDTADLHEAKALLEELA
jgi:predicted ATPase/class 3 adenylate cyclase/DNA-binding winged helix-turn-helix (wHTH) protein